MYLRDWSNQLGMRKIQVSDLSFQIISAIFPNFNISQLTPRRQVFEGSRNLT